MLMTTFRVCTNQIIECGTGAGGRHISYGQLEFKVSMPQKIMMSFMMNRIKRRGQILSPKWTHAQFLEELVYDFSYYLDK